MEKKTCLYEKHILAGGKMVPFAGWEMPVQYGSGVIAEHMAVRTHAGLFDVSHMGEVILCGEGALATLQKLLTNDMSGMQRGDCRYSPMCNLQGGVVDDLIVYKLDDDEYLLVVNAGNKDKDVAWMQNNLEPDTRLEDISDDVAELALQGPEAEAILRKLANIDDLPQKNYSFCQKVKVADTECLVSRTGYTGEDGFELYCDTSAAPALWDALMAAGADKGLMPCGLGARDTLRLEAGMPLYGHEMDDDITPREANLGFFIKMDKPDFNGKAALEQQGEPARRRTGLRLTGRGIAREGAEVYNMAGEKIGFVTSGTMLPYMGYAGAMALLRADSREIGSEVELEVRGRRIAAEIIKLPFYKRQK